MITGESSVCASLSSLSFLICIVIKIPEKEIRKGVGGGGGIQIVHPLPAVGKCKSCKQMTRQAPLDYHAWFILCVCVSVTQPIAPCSTGI